MSAVAHDYEDARCDRAVVRTLAARPLSHRGAVSGEASDGDGKVWPSGGNDTFVRAMEATPDGATGRRCVRGGVS